MILDVTRLPTNFVIEEVDKMYDVLSETGVVKVMYMTEAQMFRFYGFLCQTTMENRTSRVILHAMNMLPDFTNDRFFLFYRSAQVKEAITSIA